LNLIPAEVAEVEVAIRLPHWRMAEIAQPHLYALTCWRNGCDTLPDRFKNPRAILSVSLTPTSLSHITPLIFTMAINGTHTNGSSSTNGVNGNHSASDSSIGFDIRGFSPAAVTPFTPEGMLDFDAIDRIGKYFLTFPDIKSILVLGHAGEGTALMPDEKVALIKAYVKATEGKIPIISGITSEGNYVAGQEAKAAKEAGASAALVYPSHGWLRFSYQQGAPQKRHEDIWNASHLPQILFQYPQATKATLDLQTQIDILSKPYVFALKNGVRDMTRWDTEVPLIRKACPGKPILTCHDEYLIHTSWTCDGFLVGYGQIVPEAMQELLDACQAKDVDRAYAVHNRLMPLTKVVYHRPSHMEGTVALKHGLISRGVLSHATVRAPLLALPKGAHDDVHAAMQAAGAA
jgi:4-hydroxy-tetrahydrodipicolinate synthase